VQCESGAFLTFNEVPQAGM